MTRIPLIVGFGGVNAAGRSSGHHGYRRMVVDALDSRAVHRTWQSLAGLTGRTGALGEDEVEFLRSHSLVRAIEGFDATSAPWNRRLQMSVGEPLRFRLSPREVPTELPTGWRICESTDDSVLVEITGDTEMLVEDRRPLGVGSAGQVPTGFDPSSLYQERSHPRAVQLTLFAASDCLGASGLPWDHIAAAVPPDRIATYAGSAMAQLDECGNGGLLNARWRGQRISSKNVPMGLGEMAADFVNAYVLGSVGRSGHNMGACATFLYNLRLGVEDIQSGRARVVLVGGSEASLVPDVVDGLATMGALATDKALLAIEGRGEDEVPDYRRACRPFGENCGFVIAEGSQFVMLMDDDLALELGADVHAVVGDVFVHADGHKKSISSPGVGNHVTMAKAVAAAERMLSSEVVRHQSFVMAHGTGTPQNRTSESEIFDLVARAFDIERWPVAAIKCFVGHTMAAASGDQLMAALGVFEDGILPGITTIDEIAADVVADRLLLQNQHSRLEREPVVAFLNAKGFGGNNATASLYSAAHAERMLEGKHGARKLAGWHQRRDQTRSRAAAYDEKTSNQGPEVVYRFNHEVRGHEHVKIRDGKIEIEGYSPIDL